MAAMIGGPAKKPIEIKKIAKQASSSSSSDSDDSSDKQKSGGMTTGTVKSVTGKQAGKPALRKGKTPERQIEPPKTGEEVSRGPAIKR